MTALPRPTARALIDAQAWLAVAWAGVAVFALALAALMLSARWPELRMASSFFLPLLAAMLLPHGLPSLIVALLTGCTLLSAAAWALDWYALFWWFDVLLHALNPFAITAASMVMLWKADLVPLRRRQGRFVLWAALLGLALGVGWELLELTFLALTWPDTILDLVMDTAGAALGGWFAAWIIVTRGKAPIGRRGAAGLREPAPFRVRR